MQGQGDEQLVLSAEPEAGVLILSMNAPERRNALSQEMAETLVEKVNSIARSDNVGAVVLTAMGSTFCSGGDVNDMAGGEDGPMAVRNRLRRFIQNAVSTIWDAEVPVIVALNGAAIGAGFDLALAGDIRISSESAWFSTGYVRVGLVPAEGGSWLLPRLIGLESALRLLWTGKVIGAAEALALGVVSEVVPEGELLKRAVEVAAEIAKGPREVHRLIKQAVHSGLNLSFRQSLELAASHAAIASASADHREGVAAFLEKRTPQFGGG